MEMFHFSSVINQSKRQIKNVDMMIVLYEKLKQCHLVLGLVPPVDQSGMRLTTFCKNRS